LKRVRAIKRNSWEKLWEKKQNEGKKKRDVEKVGENIFFEKLSVEEQLMYLHYLWK